MSRPLNNNNRLEPATVIQVFAWALVIAAVSEWLGPLTLELGVGKVVLLPMIWALLIGLALGLMSGRLPVCRLPRTFPRFAG